MSLASPLRLPVALLAICSLALPQTKGPIWSEQEKPIAERIRGLRDAFRVEGIPKSFVLDSSGKLVAQAIDMRTKRQFLEMLKSAGLK